MICPRGSYCPDSTISSTQHLCPHGTYSAVTGLQNVSSCTPCTPGKYCGSEGLTSPSGHCSGGYFCGGGSYEQAPTDHGLLSSSYEIIHRGEDSFVTALNISTVNNVCPPGHFCPVGSRAPVQCPPGTNSSVVGAVNASQCSLCPSGFYCPLNGTVYATRVCLAGYYCPKGTANLGNDTSLLCPTGSSCVSGSHSPESCSAGTYQDERGMFSCKVRYEI